MYYQLNGGETDVLDVGAAPGTDVYAPVDGTVTGISDFILSVQAPAKAVARRTPLKVVS